LRRGDVVIAAGGGSFGGKPRPYVVVQSDDYQTSTLILAGCHSIDEEPTVLRPVLTPTAGNGLKKISEVTIDTLVTMRKAKIDQVVGRLSRQEMSNVDGAMLKILGLVTGNII
jgi:mRNA interferase MazF